MHVQYVITCSHSQIVHVSTQITDGLLSLHVCMHEQMTNKASEISTYCFLAKMMAPEIFELIDHVMIDWLPPEHKYNGTTTLILLKGCSLSDYLLYFGFYD